MNRLRTLTVVVAWAVLPWIGASARAEDRVSWATDFQQASQAAAQQNRLLLLHFYSDDCPPCARVEQQVFSQAEVAQAIAKNYVPLKIHARQSPDLAARYQVKRWPTDIFCTAAGLEIYRTTSPQTSAEYIGMIDQVALQAGVGAGRQWTSNLASVQQGTDAAAGQAQAFASRVALSAQGYADQAAARTQGYVNQAQQYAAQAQQGVAGAQQQYQQAAGQVQASAQQAVATTAGAYHDLRGAFVPGGSPAGAVPAGAPAMAVTTAGYGAPQQSTNPWVGQQPVQQVTAQMAAQYPAQQPQVQQPAYAPAPQQTAIGPMAAPGPQFVPASQAPSLGLEGYCPVTLLETMKWKKADPKFGAIHRGRTYLFASAAEQQKFLAEPDRFSPVLSGCDPVRFTQRGELVEGTRSCGLTFNKQIFLFADEASLKQFEQSPQTYIAPVYQAMAQGAAGQVYR